MTTREKTNMAGLGVNVTSESGLEFIAKTSIGNEIYFEPSPMLGGSGTIPNPMEYYLAAIGGCAAIKTKIDLVALNMPLDSVTVNVDCTRKESVPQILETIHVRFSLEGNLDDQKVAGVIHDVMTAHCPVAVMAAASAKVTWEYHISRSGTGRC